MHSGFDISAGPSDGVISVALNFTTRSPGGGSSTTSGEVDRPPRVLAKDP